MRRAAAALAIVWAGATLTFAVSAQVPGISLRAAGVILMLAGLVAAVLPPSPAVDWLRRRGAAAGTEDREVTASPGSASTGPEGVSGVGAADDDDDYPAWMLQDPAVLAAEVLNGIRDREQPGPATPPRPRAARPAGPRPLRSVPAEPPRPGGPLRLDERLRLDGGTRMEWRSELG